MSTSIPRLPAATRTFTLQLSSTRRGARLAGLPTCEQPRTWRVSPDVADRAEQIVAELAANAALHGRSRAATSASPSPMTRPPASCASRSLPPAGTICPLLGRTPSGRRTTSRGEGRSSSPPPPTGGAASRIRPAVRPSGPSATSERLNTPTEVRPRQFAIAPTARTSVPSTQLPPALLLAFTNYRTCRRRATGGTWS